MKKSIDDDQLMAVLEGRASEELERAVEVALQSEPSIRMRMEQLSGAYLWPPGSVPNAPIPVSESLHTAIIRLEKDWDEVLASYSPATSPPKGSSVPEDVVVPIPGIRIVREIGRGGMGVIFEGVDDSLGRRVAIKQLHPHYYSDPVARERWNREAQSVASLHHPNVLAIYGLQMVGGFPCIIQQLVEGESLHATIQREGAIPFPRCLNIATQIAQGLSAAHAAGIVHRDLKPDNVLVEANSDSVRIADFGLAKRIGDGNLTVDGTVAGTPAFMAPEQTDGKGTDQRSDLFSLGSVLYTMASGHPPFEDDDPYVVMLAIRSQRQRPLIEVQPSVPLWFSSLVDRLLEKNPSQRIQSCQQVLEILQQQSIPDAPQRPNIRRRIGAVAIGGLLATAAIVSLVWPKDDAGPNPKEPAKASSASEIVPQRLEGIVTQSDGQKHERLEDAVAHAKDGDTIFIAHDIESGQIDIAGKTLSLEAAPGTNPSIRLRESRKETSGVFLRSDSALRLKGLRVEWRTASSSPWMEEGRVLALISSGQDKKLTIENCSLHRLSGGVCLGVGGDLEMRHTRIQGGDIAVAWYAHSSDCVVENCLLNSKIGIGVVYPSANERVIQSSHFRMLQSSLVTESVVDLFLTRVPTPPATFHFERCVFDSKNAATMTTTPLFGAELFVGDGLAATFKQCALWSDAECVYAAGMDYLVTRRLRMPNRKNSSGIDSLDEWHSYCFPIDGGSSPRLGSMERTISSELPPIEETSPNASIVSHRFEPDLPMDWNQESIVPGMLPPQ